MQDKHYSFFQNTECEFFPCHRIADPGQFNCLFCYCPLYGLGPRCGGNFRYNEKGIKDCSDCVIPHLKDNYGRIIGKWKEEAGLSAAIDGISAQAGKQFRRIVMMACTERGFEAMRRAAAALAEKLPQAEILQTGHCAYVPGFEQGTKLSEITKKWFEEADALVYFAAAGIAVRCIAPYVRDKFRDPAVLSVDENARFVIPLLSGHAGGANDLGKLLAQVLGAQPVITTATDGRGLFAVDVYAAENGLQIGDREQAKRISARILAGETVTLYAESAAGLPSARNSREQGIDDQGMGPGRPKYRSGVMQTACRSGADIIVSCRKQPGDREDALYLIPRAVTLGVGCRKGIPAGDIEKAAAQILQKTGVFKKALCGAASIDLKKEEAGLQDFTRRWELPLTFYSAGELNEVKGTFTGSDFVRGVTGVDCVCERSAVRLAGEGAVLLSEKQSLGGVTAALAVTSDAAPDPLKTHKQ